jgi:hypothetical protein
LEITHVVNSIPDQITGTMQMDLLQTEMYINDSTWTHLTSTQDTLVEEQRNTSMMVSNTFLDTSNQLDNLRQLSIHSNILNEQIAQQNMALLTNTNKIGESRDPTAIVSVSRRAFESDRVVQADSNLSASRISAVQMIEEFKTSSMPVELRLLQPEDEDKDEDRGSDNDVDDEHKDCMESSQKNQEKSTKNAIWTTDSISDNVK